VFDLTALALNLPVFFLVLCRAGGIVIAAPVLGGSALPPQIRVVLAALLALVMYPFAAKYAGPLPDSALGMAPLVLKELGLGLLMGFAAGMVIAAVRAAGGLAAQAVGLGLGELISPDEEEEARDEVSLFFEVLALLLFLAVDGHHWFIEGLAVSWRDLPLGKVVLRPEALHSMTVQFSNVTIYALRMAAPLIAIMFLVDVLLALSAKAVPQMNILTVGYPVKVFIGLTSLALTLPLMWPVIREAFHSLHYQLTHFSKFL
jgi:flagellar biosynthetic protein FliR